MKSFPEPQRVVGRAGLPAAFLALFLAIPAALAAEAPRVLGRPAQESPILARFGEEVVTLADFEAEMARRSGGPGGSVQASGQFTDAEARHALLEEMLLFRVLVAKARAQGYERDPEVVSLLERTLVAKLLRDQLDPRLETIAAGDAEIEQLYALHKDEYAQPARAEAAIIWVSLPRNAEPAQVEERRGRAQEALAAARELPAGTAHFGSVATKYSDHRESRALGGRIGWLDQGAFSRWDTRVVEALFALKRPLELAPLVETDDGFYLIKLIGREERRFVPLAALRDGLRARWVKERRDAERGQYEARALADAGIEIDSALLASIAPPPIRPPEPLPVPPPLPQRPDTGQDTATGLSRQISQGNTP